MIDALVILGGSGDLAGRLLLPAVAALRARGELAPGFRVVAAGHQPWSDADFVAHVRRRLAAHAPGTDPRALDEMVRYRQADVTDPTAVAEVLRAAGPGPIAVYFALPTRLMLPAVRAVRTYPLATGSRLVVEKPFGEDEAGAVELNAALAGAGSVYRVDHVLAMSTVQQLRSARLPGTDRPVEWGSRAIARIELLFDETLALEGRASFYDRAGALRDVMQNHLVQVLCTLAAAPGPGTLAERRADVLRAVRPLTPDDVRTTTRRARYAAGRLSDTGGADGREVPDYAAEDGVDPTRDTETFAEFVLHLDDPRWAGTPFVLRAGKALARRRRGVELHGHDGRAVFLDLDEPRPDEPAGAEPMAYQRIVADVLAGGTSYAVDAAEAELAWRVVTPVLAGWAAGAVPLTTYPAGSAGP